MTAGSTEITALSALLEVEYAVCYGLSAGGGRLAVVGNSPAALAATHAAYDSHRIRRDQLVAALTAAAATVPDPAPAYSIPRLDSAAEALTFLGGLTTSAARTFRDQLVGLDTPDFRRLAVVAVIDDARYAADMLRAAGQSAAQSTSALPGS
jgi:hypothetical protein